MPYISKNDNRREELRNGKPALNAGELNYQIFYYVKHCKGVPCYAQIIDYVDQFVGDNPNYQRYNDMTGCLIRCYKEIQRRLNINLKDKFTEIMEKYDKEIEIYEDKKIKENSDVE